jgi:hypothetical protein
MANPVSALIGIRKKRSDFFLKNDNFWLPVFKLPVLENARHVHL